MGSLIVIQSGLKLFSSLTTLMSSMIIIGLLLMWYEVSDEMNRWELLNVIEDITLREGMLKNHLFLMESFISTFRPRMSEKKM